MSERGSRVNLISAIEKEIMMGTDGLRGSEKERQRKTNVTCVRQCTVTSLFICLRKSHTIQLSLVQQCPQSTVLDRTNYRSGHQMAREIEKKKARESEQLKEDTQSNMATIFQ